MHISPRLLPCLGPDGRTARGGEPLGVRPQPERGARRGALGLDLLMIETPCWIYGDVVRLVFRSQSISPTVHS